MRGASWDGLRCTWRPTRAIASACNSCSSTARPLLQDELGRTPAHLACEEGNDGALAELCWDEESGEWSRSLTLPDRHGLTALHLAAAFGHPDCMQLALAAGAETVSETGRSALHWAHIGGDQACIQLALEAVLHAGLPPDTADELFDRADRSEVGMHAGSTSVTLRHEGSHTVLAWDGTRSDSPWYPRSSRRSFVNTWDLMETQLRSLVPSTSLPLVELVGEGKFRGHRSR